MKDIIGKEVFITVSFADGYISGGSLPGRYMGRVISVEDDFIKIDINQSSISDLSKNWHTLKRNTMTGICLINKKYIVSIFEI